MAGSVSCLNTSMVFRGSNGEDLFEAGTIDENGARYPRSANSPDLRTERVMTCEPWMNNTAAYWKYEYEVPAYCYSK